MGTSKFTSNKSKGFGNIYLFYIQDEVDEVYEKRQLPPVDKDALEKVVLAKLQFLINLGLLKHIPLLGQFIHDMVANDPEGVARAVNGGIFALLGLVGQILARG